MTPYERGHAAYYAGRGRNLNPYLDEDNEIEGVSDDVVAWDSGWDDAEESDRLAKAESRNAGKHQ